MALNNEQIEDAEEFVTGEEDADLSVEPEVQEDLWSFYWLTIITIFLMKILDCLSSLNYYYQTKFIKNIEMLYINVYK